MPRIHEVGSKHHQSHTTAEEMASAQARPEAKLKAPKTSSVSERTGRRTVGADKAKNHHTPSAAKKHRQAETEARQSVCRRVCVCMYACMYVCMRTRVHACMHAYQNVQKNKRNIKTNMNIGTHETGSIENSTRALTRICVYVWVRVCGRCHNILTRACTLAE